MILLFCVLSFSPLFSALFICCQSVFLTWFFSCGGWGSRSAALSAFPFSPSCRSDSEIFSLFGREEFNSINAFFFLLRKKRTTREFNFVGGLSLSSLFFKTRK